MIENKYLDEEDNKIILIHASSSQFNDTISETLDNKIEGGKMDCVKNNRNNNGESSVYAYKTNTEKPKDKDGLSGGAIDGIVIACVVVAAIFALLVYFLVIKKKKKKINQ